MDRALFADLKNYSDNNPTALRFKDYYKEDHFNGFRVFLMEHESRWEGEGVPAEFNNFPILLRIAGTYFEGAKSSILQSFKDEATP